MKILFTLITYLICIQCNSLFAQFNLQGDGYSTGNNCYVLTEEVGFQVSTIWHEDYLDINIPFELQFTMNFGDQTEGADGMMFVLQLEGPEATGNVGQGMGYGSMNTCLGIEFDTFKNDDLFDPWPDHIAIHRDGNTNHQNPNNLAGPIQAHVEDLNIEDGLDHAIRITWDPTTHLIEVYFDCEFRLSTTIDLVEEIFGGEHLVWWGFTASTGGANNLQSVCLYENVQPSDDIGICPGFSTQLIAGGDIYSEYSWSPIDYLDDPTVYNPIATPPSSQVYSVTYTDFCGNIQTNTIEVTVEAVEVEIIADEEVINCENDIVNMSAYTNYPNATITWEVLEGQELINQELYSASSTGAGIYSVEVVSLDGNCSDEDTFEVIVDTTSYSANAGESFELNCLTTSYVLQGSSDGDDATFVWSTTDGQFFGSTFTPNPTVLSDGTYTLEVTNPNNECTSTSSVVITEDVAVPEVDLGYPSSDISCDSPMIQIIGTTINPPGYTNIIEWDANDGFLINPEQIEPYTDTPGTYGLTVTFLENGCTTSLEDSIEVFVDEYAFISIESLIMPNVFTPNGDSYNNVLRPVFSDPELSHINPITILDELDIWVRDRWGQLVYENHGDPNVWDGYNLNGVKVSSGTYLVEVKYMSDCIEVQTGEYMGVLEVIAD